MQPRRPQGHLAPPRLTTRWPISPAAPRPSHGLPSRTRPPPTPVPQKTPIRLWNSRPAPRWNSASVATWTSLPTLTSVPSASFSVAASGKLPSQPGRLRAAETMPVFSSASPGEPTPTPLSSAGSTLACSAASRSAAAISAATPSGPPLVGVGRRASPSTSPPASTIAVWIFVPPKSIPPRSSATRAVYAARMSANGGQRGWKIWWAKRRWYERNRGWLWRRRIDRHAARGGFFIRYPVEGEVLEALEDGRLEIGRDTLLEPGCWLTLSGEARIRIGQGCFLNRNTM